MYKKTFKRVCAIFFYKTGGRLDVFWYFQYSFCSVALSSELVILYYQSRVPEVKTRLAV